LLLLFVAEDRADKDSGGGEIVRGVGGARVAPPAACDTTIGIDFVEVVEERDEEEEVEEDVEEVNDNESLFSLVSFV
jgi:hypothetical protein